MEFSTNQKTVIYNKKKYTLTDQAECTSSLLPDPYTNYHEARAGEEYYFEMGANAVDESGNRYFVTWIFSGIKGVCEKAFDAYDYRHPDAVTAI